MSHTPGPWTAYAEEVFADAGGYIAKVGDGQNIDVDDANARLIAAAPEMFEELNRLLDVVDTIDFPLIMAVLNKAKGEWND